MSAGTSINFSNCRVFQSFIGANFARFMFDFDEIRVNPSREFFQISPEKAKIALQISGGKDVTPTNEIVENKSELDALNKQGIKIDLILHL